MLSGATLYLQERLDQEVVEAYRAGEVLSEVDLKLEARGGGREIGAGYGPLDERVLPFAERRRHRYCAEVCAVGGDAADIERGRYRDPVGANPRAHAVVAAGDVGKRLVDQLIVRGGAGELQRTPAATGQARRVGDASRPCEHPARRAPVATVG